MDMSRLREFWLGWRKEIIRGGLIFGAVVFIGIAVTRMFGWLPLGIAQGLGNIENWDWDHNSGDRGDRGRRDWQEAYRWAGQIKASHWVWIRNTNGPVEVEPTDGDSLVVTADKSSRRSNPEDVEIRVVEHDGTVTLCAMWRAAVMECGAEGVYRLKDQRKSDVAVRFRVQLPRGLKINASTINGPVEVEGAESAVALSTVNGRINAVALGPVQATTVNGSIHASMHDITGDDPVELKTVNGSIMAELPAELNADLDASTVSGKISTELPLQLTGKVSPRAVKARIGTGGRRLTLSTVNGSIEITASEQDHPKHPKH
jgi:hypothetical protein